MPQNLNPVLDEANFTMTGSLGSAMALCEVSVVKFTFERARASYSRGWVHRSLNAAPILYSCTILVQDLYQLAFQFTFDLTDDDALLNTGKNLRRTMILCLCFK